MSMKSKLSTTALLALVAMSALATTNANAFQVKTTIYCEDGPMFPSCGIHQVPQQQARYYIPPPRHGGRGDTLPAHTTARDLEDRAMSYAGGGGGGR
jgi:hypothetical protein